MKTTIATTGHVTIFKKRGRLTFGVIFERADESIQKTYQTSVSVGVITDGVVSQSKTQDGLKLTIRSIATFGKLYPNLFQKTKDGGREGCCQVKGTTHQFCFPSCCEHAPVNFKCVQSRQGATRISCSCHSRKALRNILPQ
jgi:hypothetical protein